MKMAPKNLLLKWCFTLLLLLISKTLARPSPWFGAIYDHGFDKHRIEESNSEEVNIDMKRMNSRMIGDKIQFWSDLTPAALPRHLAQALSGALRICDILR